MAQSSARQMSLVGFMQAGNTTVYAGSWRHPATEHGFLDAALLPEARPHPRGGLLRHDVLRRPPGHARHLRRIGGRGGAPRRAPGEARPERGARPRRRAPPSSIGLGATYSTTYYSPFHVARTFATLDHLSGGRAAWNVVTSVNDSEAQNFGVDARTSATTSATTGPTSSSTRPPACGTRGRTTPSCSTARAACSPTPTGCTSSKLQGRVVQGAGSAHRARARPRAGRCCSRPDRRAAGVDFAATLGGADLHRRPGHRGRARSHYKDQKERIGELGRDPDAGQDAADGVHGGGRVAGARRGARAAVPERARPPDGVAHPAVRADELRLLRHRARRADHRRADRIGLGHPRAGEEHPRAHRRRHGHARPTWPVTGPRCSRARASSAPDPRWPTRWRSGSAATRATASSSPRRTRPGAYEDVVRLVVPELQRRGRVPRPLHRHHAARPPRPGASPSVDGGPPEPVTAAVRGRSGPDGPSWPRRRAASGCARRPPSSGADLVFLDLEDACAPIAKESARGDRGRGAHRPGLGPHRAGRAGERHRHAVVPRRRHRGRHRRPGRARRAHRPEGPSGPRRVVVRRPAHPARDEARDDASASASRCSSRRPRGWPTRPRSPGPATGSRRSSSAPATCPPRCGPGSTATSTRSASTPATSGTSPACRCSPPPGRGHRRHRRAVPRLPGPRRVPPQPPPTPACSGFDGKWAIHPSQIADRQRGVLAHRGRDRRRPGGDRGVPRLGGRRRGRDRARRPAGRRRPHAPGREHAPQGVAGRRRARPMSRRLPGGPVGHRQHRHQVPAGRDRAPGPGAGRRLVVHSPDKAGRDAGELCGRRPDGRRSPRTTSRTSSRSAPTASSTCRRAATSTRCAGCSSPGATSSRPEASSTTRPSLDPATRERIEAACAKGGTSIHSTGSSPGFITEAVPLVLTSIQRRLDRLAIDEFADLSERELAGAAVRDHGLRPAIRRRSATGRWDHGAAVLRPVAATPGRGARRCPSTRSRRAARWRSRRDRSRSRPAASTRAPSPAQRMTVDRPARWSAAARASAPTGTAAPTSSRPGTCARPGWRIDGRRRRPARRRAAPSRSRSSAWRETTPGYTANRAVNAVPVVCAAAPGIRTTVDLPAGRSRRLGADGVRPAPRSSRRRPPSGSGRRAPTGSLRIQGCTDCGTLVHPPVPICPKCRSRAWQPTVVSGRARVVGLTVNAHPWSPDVPARRT